MDADAVGPHAVEETGVAGREPVDPAAADELLAAPAADLGQMLVGERDPPVHVETDREQVHVLEHVAQPAGGCRHLLHPRAQLGLQPLVLDRERRRTAHGVDLVRFDAVRERDDDFRLSGQFHTLVISEAEFRWDSP